MSTLIRRSTLFCAAGSPRRLPLREAAGNPRRLAAFWGFMSRLSRFHSPGRDARIILAVALSLSIFCACARAQSVGAATLTIPADRPGAVVSTNLFGIFFEEINFAGEGGLYAEMVRNRSLDNSANADYWTPVTQGTAA